MDAFLLNMDVTVTFEGIFLAKSPLKLDRQEKSARIALKFIIGQEAFIYNDATPITKHAILTIIAKGPLAMWTHKNLLIAHKTTIQATTQNGNLGELILLKVFTN